MSNFTLIKKNPTQGEITSSLTGSTGDGSGLHFDGIAGNIDIASPPDLGTKFSFEFVIKADSTGSSDKIIDFGDGGRFVIEHGTSGLQVKPSNAGGWVTLQNPSPLADLAVHHLVMTVDGTTATLFDNGNVTATATISATDIDSCADAKIGSYYDSATDLFAGTIYRARFYNHTLSAEDVRTAFERADIDYSSQYGSETKLNSSTCVNATSSNAFNTFSGASATGFTAVSTGAGSSSQFAATADEISFVKGKKYSITFDATLNSGTAPKWNAAISILSATGTTDHSIATVTAGANGGIFTANQTTTGVISFKSEGGAATNFAISNLKVVRCGVVTDYDLAFANPTQSLTVQDRAAAADGTCSASGVSQVNSVVQLNATAARIGTTQATPADGEIVAEKIGLNKSASHTLDIDGDVNIDANHKLRWGGGNAEIIGDGSYNLDFKTYDGSSTTTKLTIDSGGDILQQASSPAYYFGTTNASHYNWKIAAQDAVSGGFEISTGGTSAGSSAPSDTYTPRLTIKSNGESLFNCASTPSNSVQGFAIHGSSSANISSSGSSTTAYNHFNIFNGTGQVGSIVSNGSATAFNTSSDYRLKENLEPLTGALDRLDALPVYRFNFKADPDTTVDGFVAHEIQAHVPEAVTGEKDAMKTVVVQEAVAAVEAVEAQPATYWEEGDELPEGVAVGDEKTPAVEAVEAVEAVAEVTEEQIDPQGIDQSKLVPLLVAAVKELKAKVETLENA
jgi:hypothetical protein